MILLATQNKNKLIEIEMTVRDASIKFITLNDLGLRDDVTEDGSTFEENALKKSKYFSKKTGLITVADDSGICIDALDGKPGVYSARYGGSMSNEARRNKILKEMEGVPENERTARQVCVIALSTPGAETHLFKGQCEGIILEKASIDNGLTYDPIFFYPPLNCTFAELSKSEKNQVSHRGEAARKLVQFLKTHRDQV